MAHDSIPSQRTVTDHQAVLAALAEFDELGRDAFLEKYGFGRGLSYFIKHNGKLYDSKAIYGAAFGYQYPQLGPLRNNQFSGGNTLVREPLEAIGFHFERHPTDAPGAILSDDLSLIQSARSNKTYYDNTPEQMLAYRRVHRALQYLGSVALDILNATGDLYELKLTSGYTPTSGARGGHPKDLWFGIFKKANADAFLGNPQFYCIVRYDWIEFGFGAMTHPSDFSNPDIKNKSRSLAPVILDLLPFPNDELAISLSHQLLETGNWHFRKKQRLGLNADDFSGMEEWLDFIHSEEGVRNAGGCISRVYPISAIDDLDLEQALREAAHMFQPWMESATVDNKNSGSRAPNKSFAKLIDAFTAEFSTRRTGPFRNEEPLSTIIEQICARLRGMNSVRRRPEIHVEMSVGKGNWSRTPWIALLDTNVTTTTQQGMYIVFLFAEDLSSVYLTLNQGMTELVNQHGQPQARAEMANVATKTRAAVGAELEPEFILDNNVDLRTSSWRSTLYQDGAIAHVRFEIPGIPTDHDIDFLLEKLLSAYAKAAGLTKTRVPQSISLPEPGASETSGHYSIDDALSDLFFERQELEQFLEIWKAKKNLILQGPPGVGKTFLAKRLAYLLIGKKNDGQVGFVQFHQSYSYEDFVQGYRPIADGGFSLRNGIFYNFCQVARERPTDNFVFLIDEINRGNLSKILGELMMLIEADKRKPEWALSLTYANPGEDDFYIPENIFILGMMNTADRSLSLVDYALRRRFAFQSLIPKFESPKFKAFIARRGVPDTTIDAIVKVFGELNAAISEDRQNLGPGFQIGHSFFIPARGFEFSSEWISHVLQTEIRPLLYEYWFDAPELADEWFARLSTAT